MNPNQLVRNINVKTWKVWKKVRRNFFRFCLRTFHKFLRHCVTLNICILMLITILNLARFSLIWFNFNQFDFKRNYCPHATYAHIENRLLFLFVIIRQWCQCHSIFNDLLILIAAVTKTIVFSSTKWNVYIACNPDPDWDTC